MSSEEIFEKVKEIIVEQLGVAETAVTMEASFIDDLGADSLDIVELVMALEEEFDIEIPDSDAEKVVTVGDVVEYIKENKIIKSTEIVLSFVITSINEDGVTIHTNDSFSLDGAGMFLKGEQKDFKVLKGDSLKLTTLTLDYGYIFIFSLE